MKKFLLSLIAISLPSFAFHNLSLTPDTAVIGTDSIRLQGAYEKVGDTAYIVRLFLDVNGNGVYDQGTDLDYLQGKELQFVDGGSPANSNGPVDTVRDGLIDMKIASGGEGPFGSPGKIVMTVESDGDSSSASIVMVQAKTSTYVKGKVTDPSGNPLSNIPIAVYLPDSSGNNSSSLATAFTGTDGTYTIFLNTAVRGNNVQIGINTDNSTKLTVDPTWILPSAIDTVVKDSLLNINFAFSKAGKFISGKVIDEHGNPVAGLNLSIQAQGSNGNGAILTTGSNGTFVGGVSTGTYWINCQSDSFLSSQNSNNVTVGPGDDTVKITFNVLTTNDSIAGRVTDDSGIIGKNADMDAGITGSYNSQKYNGYTDIDHAGPYALRVNSAIDTCGVQFNSYNFPKYYFFYPTGFSGVHPGNSSCDIAILKGDAVISGTISDSLNNHMQCSLIFADSATKMFLAVNSDGNGNFNQAVPSGVYTITFNGYDNALNNGISGSVGPITITTSDTMLNLVGKAGSFAAVKKSAFTRYNFGFSLINMHGFLAFSFSSPVEGTAKIRLYDLHGRLIGTAFDGKILAGAYTMNWTRESRIFSGKMLIAKLDISGVKQYSKVSSVVVP